MSACSQCLPPRPRTYARTQYAPTNYRYTRRSLAAAPDADTTRPVDGQWQLV